MIANTMPEAAKAGRWRLAVSIALIVGIMMLGGSSRIEALSQTPARLIAVVPGTILLMGARRGIFREFAPLLAMLLGFALVGIMTLVPVPSDIWQSLPGRSDFIVPLKAAGALNQWRAISLAPDYTLGAVLSLVVPGAAVVAVASTGMRRVPMVIAALNAACLVNAVFALVQLASGAGYFYAITNFGSAVGLFANRNHFAALLALWPVLMTAQTALALASGRLRKPLGWATLAVACLAAPLILATGSRAGLVLLLVTVASLAALVIGEGRRAAPALVPFRVESGWRRQLPVVALIVLGLVPVVLTLVFARSQTLDRIMTEDVAQELRLQLFAPLVALAWRFFPVGSGLGSFIDVFKMWEPLAALQPAYLNHAHNDLLELVIEGGLATVVLVVVFASWWGWAAMRCWSGLANPATRIPGRVGVVITLELALASLTDYPLRTPALAVLFTIACCWMARAAHRSQRGFTEPDRSDRAASS